VPIFEYKCYRCGHKFEKLSHGYKELVTCPDCKGMCAKIPSVPGFRRDHTLVEK